MHSFIITAVVTVGDDGAFTESSLLSATGLTGSSSSCCTADCLFSPPAIHMLVPAKWDGMRVKCELTSCDIILIAKSQI